MNRQAVSFLLGGTLLLGFALPTNANKSEGVLDRIQRTGVLKVAIREDAPPFGYLTPSGELQGYCLDFFALLEQQLVKNLERNTLSVKLFKSSTSSRFSLVENKTIDLECGPNTIPQENTRQVNFSDSFFLTGTQFLVKNKKKKTLNPNRNLGDVTLGVIGNTSTADYLAENYPNATLRKFEGVTARARGIEAVEQGKIAAMVSDGILLRAAAQQQGLSALQYPLVPDVPLTCDRYGMIIQSEDSQWQDFVNSVIDTPEAEQLTDAWFGQLFNYTQTAGDFCNKITKK